MRSEQARAQRYIPFGHKLMMTYCVFIIIPVMLAGYVANTLLVRSIEERTRDTSAGTLKQMKDNIYYRMQDMERISDMLYFDTTLADHLRHYEAGWVSYTATTKYVVPRIQTALEAANSKIWMSVYLHNETLREIYSLHANGDPLAGPNSAFDLYHIYRIAEKPWYRQFPKEKYGDTLEWRQIEDDTKYAHISLLRRIVDTKKFVQVNEMGFIRIRVRLADLFASVDSAKIGSGSSIYLLDGEGRIVPLTGQMDRSAGQPLSESRKKGHIVIEEHLEQLDLRIVALIPSSITDAAANNIRLWTIMACVAGCVMFSVVGLFISRYFARKVTKIVSVVDSFQEGDFGKRVQFKGKDEFSRISLALNDMGQNIGSLIREVYMTNIQKKEAELESLQAQINPHFLYNTLSSISRLARFGEVDKLHRMVLDLAKFYRLTLNEGRIIIPIRDEIEQVEAYINIQRTKFGEGLKVYYDIDPALYDYETVKLILQPFVENVLEHGLYGERIHLRIVGHLQDSSRTIVFKIIDDGVGINHETLRSLFDPSESLNVGLGIRNVHQRIRLHYGDDYGVAVSSGMGIGTAVVIRIPAKPMERARAVS
ncbi:sensor histidine kinase YesM [Paenibacillus phyllosphaerae]|uniref:histidine kinase n=1 Tax=Paenibacillus phyllosphaerae TaxID=274593 RepID=A0A7W5FNI3_9BACL|nr:sensor histidine kinase [Paenibacillus phyllosphaerae]MBB3111208.1 sensor histidine kinase YesM [Paenibacillus phyllosphaerae]